MLEKNLLSEDYEQIVILGSGFDHSGALYSSKGFSVFEIDTPFMISNKQKMLGQFCFSLAGLHLCSIDPTNQNIKEVLTQTHVFDFDKKTLFLAEGFFDYLSLNSVRSILESIKSFSSNFKIVSTFFDLGELNRFMFTSGVAMVGETLKFPLNRKKFLELMSEYEIETKSQLSYAEMRSDLVEKMNLETDLSVLKGFYILESELN